MAIEPVSIQVAASALEVSKAALGLSDSVIGRIKGRRIMHQAEEQRLREWLANQLAIARTGDTVRLAMAISSATEQIWNEYWRQGTKYPDAEPAFASGRDQALATILRVQWQAGQSY